MAGYIPHSINKRFKECKASSQRDDCLKLISSLLKKGEGQFFLQSSNIFYFLFFLFSQISGLTVPIERDCLKFQIRLSFFSKVWNMSVYKSTSIFASKKSLLISYGTKESHKKNKRKTEKPNF